MLSLLLLLSIGHLSTSSWTFLRGELFFRYFSLIFSSCSYFFDLKYWDSREKVGVPFLFSAIILRSSKLSYGSSNKEEDFSWQSSKHSVLTLSWFFLSLLILGLSSRLILLIICLIFRLIESSWFYFMSYKWYSLSFLCYFLCWLELPS